ncbi:gas vesicle protein GvpG [Streptomyces sp. NA04227]|uniref:gas vesicle protein GvpG n=1 Tax=Streptomyces sp. NA04227 TaxID=2742136 RepID=UPI0015920C8B|nr:gas vesicle protein GvpG [Streptomyces sp. NA04227]QKW09989.1 gas vesicle protein GvpG [Streptomyces sp. NA04227]
MGLLSGVLLLPLAPVRGVTWVAERLVDAAEKELHDPAVLRARLGALHEAYESGEIGSEQFEREEERLLDLLERRTPTPHPVPLPPAETAFVDRHVSKGTAHG